MMIDLGDLKVFVQVVSAQNMSQAARALGLSAAAVSKRIRRLEGEIGVRLLQRTTRTVSITPAGQQYDCGPY